MKIKIEDISIPDKFKMAGCRKEKIDKALTHIRETGLFDKPVVLNEENTLVDGYSRYLAAKYAGIKEIPCRYTGDIVYCRFDGNKKVYAWINPRHIPVQKGDRVLVENKDDFAVVEVVKTSKTCKIYPKRKILRKAVPEDER